MDKYNYITCVKQKLLRSFVLKTFGLRHLHFTTRLYRNILLSVVLVHLFSLTTNIFPFFSPSLFEYLFVVLYACDEYIIYGTVPFSAERTHCTGMVCKRDGPGDGEKRKLQSTIYRSFLVDKTVQLMISFFLLLRCSLCIKTTRRFRILGSIVHGESWAFYWELLSGYGGHGVVCSVLYTGTTQSVSPFFCTPRGACVGTA